MWSHIQCSTKVVKIRRDMTGRHIVTTTHVGVLSDDIFDAVAICTGLHVEPCVPRIEGIERVSTVLHSSKFKSRQQLRGKADGTVVVLGVGETAMDVGHLAVTNP